LKYPGEYIREVILSELKASPGSEFGPFLIDIGRILLGERELRG
jgi:hypothetical protein